MTDAVATRTWRKEFLPVVVAAQESPIGILFRLYRSYSLPHRFPNKFASAFDSATSSPD